MWREGARRRMGWPHNAHAGTPFVCVEERVARRLWTEKLFDSILLLIQDVMR